MQIQFRVEKFITADHMDVNYLSIFRFPSLQSYKSVINLAREELEKNY